MKNSNKICKFWEDLLFDMFPRGVMDNTQDSGSCTGGSIPSEGATKY